MVYVPTDYSRSLLLATSATGCEPESLRGRIEASQVHISVDTTVPGSSTCLRVLAADLRRLPIQLSLDPGHGSGRLSDDLLDQVASIAAGIDPERTITVWSFSKWLGFAGLRVGAIIANPDLMERLANAPPNNLGSNVVVQRGAIAGLEVKQQWFPGVRDSQRRNQAMVRETALTVPGLELPVFPSNGNFLIIECEKAGVRPEAICAVMARHNILVRQGSYHTKAFGDRFIKVSVSVPETWVEEFCALLPRAVEEARGINEPLQLY